MGKKLRNFLVAFVAALGLVVLAFASQTTTTKAAAYSTNDLLSGMSIQQKNYGTASDVNLTLDWDATGKELHDGDTWTIQLPDTLKVKKAGESIPITDKDGITIGNAVLNSDNTITVTFNDKVEGKNDFSGSINITNGIGVGKEANVGNNNVIIGDFNDNMTVTTSDADFSKKGEIGTDENGDAIVTWTILVNRNSKNYPNLTVEDYIDPKTSGQTYIKGSVKVYEAAWIPARPGYYNKTKQITNFPLEEFDNGFKIDSLPKDDQFYAVTLQTKINDPEKMVGEKFKNHADFTWGNGSGNGGINTGVADGSVTSNANSGNGNGKDIIGMVTLTKSDENNGTLLAGAVYDLYEYGNDTAIQTNLTTDENGQIIVKDLPMGDYYFKEVTAPNGYQTSGTELPFTINKNLTNVSVEAKDEKEGNTSGSIAVMKMDEATGYRLAGAEFTIYDSNGNSVGTITTDNLGIAHRYNLPQGEYTIKETKAPDGYLLTNQEYKFTIDDNNLTPGLFFFENTKEDVFDDSYLVKLHKTDSKNAQIGVPGAEYTLYNSDGSVVETKVTDENGYIQIDGLKPGDYYFKETKAPNGYDLNDTEYHFTIISGTTEIQTIQTTDSHTNGGGNTTDPDVDGNGDNGGNEDNNNGGGIIVDPNHPGSNNNGNNNNNGGIITNPGNNNSTNTNNTLPQTGSKSGLATSLIGLVVLLGTVYFKRRHA
ncbi:LPXTG cell wall anchor domain-containing protein [Companilactobacillus zhachilii]|uniref:LPXTG cell wall anchor domain-containing protein n=1 Tax=Companilactobacillus zhachilii TaxID=2304606 RepID=UPI001923CA6D|nr:LPXTG cell wall anchor domain-containing protein [Companilactobacillus zhachilii]MBL3531598.1 LPXTG cell wall anchor domain-containing protein [Companilactobacillus zhachilii]